MDNQILFNFPLPMMTATLFCVIAVLAWRLELGTRRASIFFSALFGFCAVEAFLVALRFGYDINELIPLQRALPMFLGPLIYLSFAAMTVGKRIFTQMSLIHLTVPVIVLGLFQLLVENLRYLDWMISFSYLYYIITLTILWRKGPDALIYAKVEATRSLSNWMLRGIGLLIFTLVLDTAISADFALNKGANVLSLISFGTIPLVIVLLAFLMSMPQLLARTNVKARPTIPSDNSDIETEESLRALMVQDRLFLDPDITVQRLAKRLHKPARAVSGAINRVRGMNASQYVNEFRLAYAADLLINSDYSVTKVAGKSGFMTRSNFYREFQRVYAQSPTEYRNSNRPIS